MSLLNFGFDHSKQKVLYVASCMGRSIDSVKREAMGKMGRKYVLEHFSYDVVYHKLIDA